MLKSYIVIAWRNLWRNKAFSAINIIGLAIGMASAVIILLWIQNEISFDRFHEKGNRIYAVWNRTKIEGKVISFINTPKPMARTLEKDLPEVEQAVKGKLVRQPDIQHWG